MDFEHAVFSFAALREYFSLVDIRLQDRWGILAAYLYSVHQTFTGGIQVYFDTTCALVTLVLARSSWVLASRTACRRP